MAVAMHIAFASPISAHFVAWSNQFPNCLIGSRDTSWLSSKHCGHNNQLYMNEWMHWETDINYMQAYILTYPLISILMCHTCQVDGFFNFKSWKLSENKSVYIFVQCISYVWSSPFTCVIFFTHIFEHCLREPLRDLRISLTRTASM